MANFLDNLADHLEDEGIGTVGTDIFVGQLPPDPDNCIALLGEQGTTPIPSRYISDFEYPAFQVIVRNDNYGTGAEKLTAVRTALHVQIGLQLTNYFVMQMHARQEGGHIGVDDKGRDEFAINFYAQIRLQNA